MQQKFKTKQDIVKHIPSHFICISQNLHYFSEKLS